MKRVIPKRIVVANRVLLFMFPLFSTLSFGEIEQVMDFGFGLGTGIIQSWEIIKLEIGLQNLYGFVSS